MIFISASIEASTGRVLRFPDRVPDRYIVILNDDIPPEQVPDIARTLASSHAGKVRGVMNDALNIFSIEMSDAQAERLAEHPLVRHVEEVTRGHLSAIQDLTQKPEPWMTLWGLDRIDQYGTGSAYNY